MRNNDARQRCRGGYDQCLGALKKVSGEQAHSRHVAWIPVPRPYFRHVSAVYRPDAWIAALTGTM